MQLNINITAESICLNRGICYADKRCPLYLEVSEREGRLNQRWLSPALKSSGLMAYR